MGTRVWVVVAVVAALVAGCTSAPDPASSPSPSAQQLTVSGAPSGTTVAVDDMAGPQMEGLTPAGPTFSITPGGKLPAPATVTVHLDAAQPVGVLVMIATRQSEDGPWSYVPAALANDRRSASFTTDHFSWFAPYTLLLSELVDTFKSQLAEGLTGGLYQDVPKPKCSQENAARADGYSVKSSTSDSVFWCFGMQDGQRVLKLVNHRRYPMTVEHTTDVLDEGSWTRYASLAALSRAFSGKDSVLAPGDTITFRGDIDRGTVRGARTSIDGFGQSLVAIQTAAKALLFILTKFGGKELNGDALLRWMDAATTAPDCAEAFPNPGKVLTACFDDKALAGLVGAVWAPVAGAVLAVAGVLAFIQGEINMLTDTINGNGRYTVQIKRAAAPAGLLLSFDGLGPAKFGTSMNVFAKALGTTADPQTPGGSCYTSRLGPSKRGLGILTTQGRNGPVQYVDYFPVTETVSQWPRIYTAAGITIGSTGARLRKAYPNATWEDSIYEAPEVKWVTVLDSSGERAIWFAVDGGGNGVVHGMRAGLAAQVALQEGCS